ncbi:MULTISPECIES: DUF1361 domain-containing protein [unclassified Leeuwenhoekiella]|uniref:DUF1361 domain-containing protein n=1 Tax=unclassified Leeuwenhoekiella TaxID=2615029 RepID=UPI000C57CA5F|nr:MULTISPECIES: DUF1361 domain-containing protein [unclassified Leeuwenhoekiella]MAW94482.1 hypothetical protein [Leeuwenhoekiella sp.]MAW96978.1 hypothetical protein [Leeuwenhoekiella sp.]MBA81160.1 hypothetical protein [Leeuwenhoekiella sp.]|tara:strand:- start:11978 stop:12655 length:678 start_codon:yes stop_codon:yes gene_type:complete
MKNFILNKYTTLKYLFAALILCFFLLVFRIKSTHDYFGLFLVWNLFLAFVPLGIAWYVEAQTQILKNKLKIATLLAIWLLFLPNAPYVITDLVHLSYSPPNWFWYDVITISVFALLSLYFGFQSIRVWRKLFATQITAKGLNLATIAVLLLCGFGIYLGRFIRFNSWDLVTNPFDLAYTILQYLINPIQHRWVWIFTLSFGLLLNAGYFSFQFWLTQKQPHDATC